MPESNRVCQVHCKQPQANVCLHLCKVIKQGPREFFSLVINGSGRQAGIPYTLLKGSRIWKMNPVVTTERCPDFFSESIVDCNFMVEQLSDCIPILTFQSLCTPEIPSAKRKKLSMSPNSGDIIPISATQIVGTHQCFDELR